jgi:hypothetical protein
MHPLLEWFTGKMGKLVFRRSHNGKLSVFELPFKRLKWSQLQKDHHGRIREASKYASAAVADPELRPVYVQMALERGNNPKRPFDTAVSDYYQHGNDLLWKKHIGDQPKPKNWDIEITRGTSRNQIRPQSEEAEKACLGPGLFRLLQGQRPLRKEVMQGSAPCQGEIQRKKNSRTIQGVSPSRISSTPVTMFVVAIVELPVFPLPFSLFFDRVPITRLMIPSGRGT